MSEHLQKIISYILGGVIGFILGNISLSFQVSYFQGHETFLLVITTLIGVIFAIVISQYTEARTLRKNSHIRDETVALITHEMRTELTSTNWAILLVLQKYADKIDVADKSELESVVASIHRTLTHSVNLLDISLLDIGKLSISLTWVPLSKVDEMMEEVVGKFKMGADRKNIKLDAKVELDSTSQVEVDMVRLRIILENLLENAFQYSMKDEKVISVHISNDKKELKIEVKDNGIGIPTEEQDKIFTEFYRASNARSTRSNGSGIGLYMCHQYVKAHRGTIRFESKVNEGTTFFVTIPLKTQADVNKFLKTI